jgi:hypothetical protein
VSREPKLLTVTVSVDSWLQLVAKKFVKQTMHPKREVKELDRVIIISDLARERLCFSDLLRRSPLGIRVPNAGSQI